MIWGEFATVASANQAERRFSFQTKPPRGRKSLAVAGFHLPTAAAERSKPNGV